MAAKAARDLFEELPSEEDIDRELEDLLSDSYWSDDGDMDSEDATDKESGLWTVDSLLKPSSCLTCCQKI